MTNDVFGSGSMGTAAAPALAHETATRAPDLQEPMTTVAAQAAAALANARQPVAVL